MEENCRIVHSTRWKERKEEKIWLHSDLSLDFWWNDEGKKLKAQGKLFYVNVNTHMFVYVYEHLMPNYPT